MNLMLISAMKTLMLVKNRGFGTNKKRISFGRKIRKIWGPRMKKEKRHI